MSYYKDYLDKLASDLGDIVVTDLDGKDLYASDAISKWADMTSGLKMSRKTMYFIGNGASAGMAAHMSADACKNGQIASIAFTNVSLLTAVSNDVSYDQSFALPLKRLGKEGDVLVAISSSGNSPNIVAGCDAARELGMKVITLSGMGGDNRIRKMGDLNFFVPAKTYGHVECAHQILLHCWLDLYMENEGIEI